MLTTDELHDLRRDFVERQAQVEFGSAEDRTVSAVIALIDEALEHRGYRFRSHEEHRSNALSGWTDDAGSQRPEDRYAGIP